MRRFLLAIVLATVSLSLFAAGSARATVHMVSIGNNFFSPLKTTVTPGDTVRWVWVGGIPHTTTSDVGSAKIWDSGTSSAAGFMFQIQFVSADGPGPFPYKCSIHALTMKDTIFVDAPQVCCSGRVGDANSSGMDEPTIGDISIMIDAKFISSNPTLITCFEEADVNQSGGADPTYDDITIGDISYLTDYLFITGTSLGLFDCF